MLRRFSALLALVFVLLAGTAPVAIQEQEQPEVQTFDTGMVERSGIALLLLDVEVSDKRGNPMPGLTKEDFTVQLNSFKVPIYSVDDLCPAEPSSTEVVVASPAVPEESQAAAVPEVAVVETLATPRVEPQSFILYFDFSQLEQNGRAWATAEARRWLEEVKQPDEQVAIIGYSSIAGLVELASFTKDSEQLIAAVESIDTRKELLDPFPALVRTRVGLCCACDVARCCEGQCPVRVTGALVSAGSTNIATRPADPGNPTACTRYAREEFAHGKRSLKAVKTYLANLDSIPGRKALLLFHQNSRQFPGRCYGTDDLLSFDHVRMLDEVGAEANLSRTAVYPVFSGDSLDALSGSAINFGANLASFTGGKHNRGITDMSRVNDQAGRESKCIYRIGLRRTEKARGKVLRATVKVRDRKLSARYRVIFLDEVDRWWRRSRAVLAAPELSRDVDVSAAIVPLSASKKGWELAVQVGLDAESLAVFPFAGKQQGNWEVGALLSRGEGSQSWEMLGVSRLRLNDELPDGTVILHERVLKQLEPGTYQLAAFVRDRAESVFGGAEATLFLPTPGRKAKGVAGPVVMRSERKHVLASLPLMVKGKSEAPTPARVRKGPVPAANRPHASGETLTILSWLCPQDDEPVPREVTRFISQDDAPLFRFDEFKPRRVGKCFRIADEVETAHLDPGTYAYHLRWKRSYEREDADERVEFDVGLSLDDELDSATATISAPGNTTQNP